MEMEKFDLWETFLEGNWFLGDNGFFLGVEESGKFRFFGIVLNFERNLQFLLILQLLIDSTYKTPTASQSIR
jgi:hypothetical protein